MAITIKPIDIPQPNRLYMTAGNDVILYISILDPIALTQIDLTGAKTWFTLKRYISDADASAIVQKVSPTNLTISDPTAGLIKVVLNSADTSALPSWFQEYYFDVQILDKFGKITTSGCGTLGIYPAVTNAKS